MLKKISFIVFLFLSASGLIWLFLRNNLHEVLPKAVYRSAQLSEGSLRYLIEEQGIKTIINLRGNPSPQDEMLWAEKNLAAHYQLTFYSLPLRAHEPISPEHLKTLIQLLETAPRPLLIHCQGGADRTGLTSALLLILEKSVNLRTAEDQFSWRYLVVRNDTTGRLTFPYYEVWLAEKGLSSSRDNLLAWVTQLQPGVNYPSGQIASAH